MRKAVALGAGCLAVAAGASAPELEPRAFIPLPTGAVTPKGWLLKQLRLQAEGLSGHLAQFWEDVMKSVWIGGDADGGLHERAPYWLNGIVPLAFLLKNAGITELDPVVGIYKAPWGPNANLGIKVDGSSRQAQPVNVLAQAEKYISYILSHKSEDGWLGPPQEPGSGEAYWRNSNALQALYQYAEAVGDSSKKQAAVEAVVDYLMEQKRRMEKIPIASWSAARWMDFALTVEWVLDNVDVGGKRQQLLDLLGMLHDQGNDWERWFEHFDNDLTHNVNNAQALKSSAVYWRYNSSARSQGYSMPELSKRRMQNMDANYGLPTGMFNGDENVPVPKTRSPSRGIELCGVVEAMFSYNTMFYIHGDAAFADRAERIAYNALPATWASPKGGDMSSLLLYVALCFVCSSTLWTSGC
eukprot:TRINITY_DN2575_c0_g1_i4.p1 TRINITY_DN2575_c0_g1~~TRINITY_DN2575_c0_g1_i4.p1  ORF type:complete len:413 (+),score=95.01 TRINITY_DN2575_c0_g1_i4:97-1335(+)